MTTIDLNADLGEGVGTDAELLAIVSSASIACGGHAGDAATMRAVMEACLVRGVRVGAHPGHVDRAHFGRFRLVLPLVQIAAQVRSQVILARQIAADVGVQLAYVKLHGALANQAAEDVVYSVAIFGTLQTLDPKLAVLALDNSMQVRAAKALGMPLIREAYADRGYGADGQLLPRQQEGAVIHDPDAVVDRCLRLALTGEIVAADGSVLRSAARSICLHGDTPGAVELARRVREALEGEGIAIAPDLPEMDVPWDLRGGEGEIGIMPLNPKDPG